MPSIALRVVSILVGLAVVGMGHPVRAGDRAGVALLPLDADKRLELYGRPVASEMSRALVAGGIDVVVIGAKMAVPEVRLIVDGSIKSRGDAIILTIRVRQRVTGIVVGEPLEETADSLATIDRAASRLSARLLPIVEAELAKPPPDGPVVEPIQPRPDGPPPGRPRAVLVGVTGDVGAATLRTGFQIALQSWGARQRGWQIVPADPASLIRAHAPAAVKQASAEHAIAFEILDYRVFEARPHEARGDKLVPLATARVRVRVAGPGGVEFERVVSTDTIVGDPRMSLDALAARVAAEVIAILRPHLRRVEATWR